MNKVREWLGRVGRFLMASTDDFITVEQARHPALGRSSIGEGLFLVKPTKAGI